MSIGLSRRLRIASGLTLSIAALSSSTDARADIVDDWEIISDGAGTTSGLHSGSAVILNDAIFGLAVYNATMAIDGRFELYDKARIPASSHTASVAAAIATAGHDTLVALYPEQKAALDAKYAASLATIPNSQSKIDGIAVGNQAAAAMLALRAHDGRFVLLPSDYVPLPPGAGVWIAAPCGLPQCIPNSLGVNPWARHVTPYGLRAPIVIDSPESLSSDDWVADYNETQAYGELHSPVRSPAQTNLGLWWAAAPHVLFHRVMRAAAAAKNLDIIDKVHLYGLIHLSLADASISAFENKERYQFWRPVQAIHSPFNTNSETPTDLTWQPVISANHPEYPSIHCTNLAATTEVLRRVLGDFVTVTVTSPGVASPLGSIPNPTLTYTRFRDMDNDIVNARIFVGLHYRNSDRAGVHLGGRVADYEMRHYLRCADSDADREEDGHVCSSPGRGQHTHTEGHGEQELELTTLQEAP
jgi:vanadium-dependent haloperoxidase-like protein